MKRKLLGMMCAIFAVFMFLPTVFANSYAEAGDVVNQEGFYDSVRFVAGKTVNSNATIDGLSFVAGNQVNLNGKVNYGFYAGNVITINEEVEKDLFAAGNIVTIDSDARIGRDVFIGGNKVVIKADIRRNIFIGASTVDLSGVRIEGDANIAAEEVIMDERTMISGKLTYLDDAKITGLESATINESEKVKHIKIDVEPRPMDHVYSFIMSVLGGYFVMIAIVYLMPRAKTKLELTDLSPKNVAINMGIGLLLLIAVPVAAILGIVTSFLLPLSLIILAIYVIAIYVSSLLSSFIVGNAINTKIIKNKNPYLSLIIGILVIKLAGLIPVLGSWITALAMFYGLGLIFKFIISRGK